MKNNYLYDNCDKKYNCNKKEGKSAHHFACSSVSCHSDDHNTASEEKTHGDLMERVERERGIWASLNTYKTI
jgi:hypothetical protein